MQPDLIKKEVSRRFSHFGLNKKNEIARLIYETSKAKKIPAEKILSRFKGKKYKFIQVKNHLLKQRYPLNHKSKSRIYLPELQIDKNNKFKPLDFKINPKNIFVEEEVRKSFLAKRIKNIFPQAKVRTIESLKSFLQENKYGIPDYNNRRDNFFVVKESYDFFKNCPCTAKARNCAYHICNLGFGCIYECTYCYLQSYTNTPGIILPVNISDFFDAFKKYPKDIRLGTGEFTDSLALDHITQFSAQLIEFFSQYPKTIFELKTKSDNIANILNSKPGRNIVIAWSLNPQRIIDKNEFFTAGLTKRLRAAKKCTEKGFDVAFHFDPIMLYKDWERDYKAVVDNLFSFLKPHQVRWISLGIFRFPRELKNIIENRFPDNEILNGEFLIGYDGKMRYVPALRIDAYKKMYSWIKHRAPAANVYLCMESPDVWKATGVKKLDFSYKM